MRENIFLKARIQNKIVSKNFKFKKNNYEKIKFKQKIISDINFKLS